MISFFQLICLQSNGLIGSRTEVVYRGRDEEFLLSPQYLFKHEHEGSAPIPVTALPEEEFTTFEPDPPITFLSDADYFKKFMLTTTAAPPLPEFEPIKFQIIADDVDIPIPKIGQSEFEVEPNDPTTDPEIVNDGITEASKLPMILSVREGDGLKDLNGNRVDVDEILGADEGDSTESGQEDVINIFDPFNQRETVNPIFNFMNGLNSQEDLTISNTNRHHQWIPFWKPFFPIRQKQRLTKRMSDEDPDMSAMESGKQEVHMPMNEIPRMNRLKQVFNRVDNYIARRIQNAIHKLRHIFDSEQEFVENIEDERKRR